MKRVLTAVVLVPLVLLAVFRAPIWLFGLLVAAVIVLALHEYLAIATAADMKPVRWLTYLLAVFPLIIWEARVVGQLVRSRYVYGDFYIGFDSPSLRIWGILALLSPVLFGACLVFRKELRMGLASVASSAFGVFYIAGSLTLLVSLRANPLYSIFIVFVLASVWSGDIAAYYVGRSLGKHKLAPIVSPNKSWEGAIASIVASVAVAFIVFHFTPQLTWYLVVAALHRSSGLDLSLCAPPAWHVLILGIVTNVAAQCGDLFESALKRGANVKDSGTLLPGHGGVLDRIDALLFAIPVVWCYVQITGTLFYSPMINP